MHTRKAKNPYTYSFAMYVITVAVTMLVIAVNSMFAPNMLAAPAQMSIAPTSLELFVDCCVRYATLDDETKTADLKPEVAEQAEEAAMVQWAVNTVEAKSYNDAFLTEHEKSLVGSIAAEYGVDEAMVLGICYHESRFIPDLVGENENGTKDWGISQCNDTTFEFLSREIGISDMSQLLDRETGIRACCALLAHYKERGLTGDDMLLAYQEGYSNYLDVKKGISQPWPAFEETKECVEVFQAFLEQAEKI